MGCLPVIFLFLAGTGMGWLCAEEAGAVLGAAAGVILGSLLALGLVLITHRKRRNRQPRNE